MSAPEIPAGHSGQILDTEIVFGRVRECMGVYEVIK